MDKLKKIWLDPVWSKVIASGIIALIAFIFSITLSSSLDKTTSSNPNNFWLKKIDLWVVALTILLAIILVYFIFNKLIRKAPVLSKQFNKYIGVYEVYHYAPHTTGNPKLTKSFLQMSPKETKYVHPLFDCEYGEIEHIDGHIFLNVKNREQQNAPSYFILKGINDAKIKYLSGVCIGIGQNQNCHPIAVKVALVRRDDISDFSIDKYKSYCSIEELTRERLCIEPYNKIVPEFLWNKCDDKDILF